MINLSIKDTINKINPVCALNGFRKQSEYEEGLKCILDEYYYKVKFCNAKILLNLNDFIDLIKQIDPSIEEKLQDKTFNLYSELFNYLTEYDLVKKKTIIVADTYDLSSDDIVNIFSTVRDITLNLKSKNLLNILFIGNWSHPEIEKQYKENTGTSYPFLDGENLLYFSDIRISNQDYNILFSLQPRCNFEQLEFILDYTQGEFFSTLYLFSAIEHFRVSISFLDELIYHLAFQYYCSFNSDKDFDKTYELLKVNDWIFSIIPGDPVKKDLLRRSNLFIKVAVTGIKDIYKPVNFYSEYILIQLKEFEEKELYHPRYPVLTRKSKIFHEILDIENQVKQSIMTFEKVNSLIKFEFFPLYIEKLRSNKIDKRFNNKYRIKDGKNMFDDRINADSLLWHDEKEPINYLSILTLGQCLELINRIVNLRLCTKKISFLSVNNSFLKCDTDQIYNAVNNDSESEIIIEKDTFFSVLFINRIRFGLLRIYSNKHTINYSINCKEFDNKFGDFSQELVKFNNLNLNSELIMNYEESKQILTSLLKYRNAIAHMRDLSDDAIHKFNQLKSSYYKTHSIRI